MNKAMPTAQTHTEHSGRSSLTLFLVITLAPVALLGGLGALEAQGLITLPISALALVSIGSLGVTIAAFAASAAEAGWAGVRELLGRSVRWRVRPVWYLVVFVGVPLAILAAFLLSLAWGAALPPAPPASIWRGLPLEFVLFVVLAFVEEVGWRGYLQPHLQRRYGALAASLNVGVIWALYHLAQWFIPSTGQADKWPFPIFAVYCVALSVLLAWIYNGTGGSLLLAILAHAAMNAAPEPWAAAWQALPAATRGPYPLIFITVVVVVLALIVALRTTPATLTAERTRRADSRRQ